MDTPAIRQWLKNLRAKTHQLPVIAIEHELDRIIMSLERPDPWPSYTLTNIEVEIIHE